MDPFRSTTALITGASRGIGAELALALAGRGADLVLVARDAERLETVAARARVLGVAVRTLPADLALPETPRRIVATLDALGVTVDHLVNNAGIGDHGRFAAVPVERHLRAVDVNLRAAVELTGRLLPGMIARRRGGVLSVASTAAFQGLPFLAIYGGTKAFLLTWTEALRYELRGSGVRACCLCPGPVDTEFFAANRLRFRPPRLATHSPREVAEAGLRGYRRGRGLVVPGLGNRLGAWGTRLFPRALVVRVASRYARRGADD
ncbi:MAG TPA: SDR family oxidoreductase [Gemmatimonadales bacterium]|nr:SDR family oxidoreductase [Gemmatimonadales bacterium]